MGWPDRAPSNGAERRASAAAGIALALGLAACTSDPPQPPFELAPTGDQIAQALQTRFSAAHDSSGAPCSNDFDLSGVAVREAAEMFMTTHRSWGMDIDVAYSVTPKVSAANLKALTESCFGIGATGSDAWTAGQAELVFWQTQIARVPTGWTLTAYASDGKTPTAVQFADAATPHVYKMGVNGRWPR